MRIMPLEFVKENQKLGCNLFDVNNRLLLGEGVKITQSNKNRLLDCGYVSVYVMDTYSTTNPKPIVSFPMQNKCIGIVKSAFKDFKLVMDLKGKPKLPSISHKLNKGMIKRDKQMAMIVKMSEDVIEELILKSDSKFEYIHPKNIFNYTYQHAISTGILSVLIGLKLKRNANEIKSLFLAAILCEIGNLTIPDEILLKKDKLTTDEFEIIKQHCIESHHEIGSCPELNYIIKLICLEHHEKVDGSGYPNGLQGDEINILAKIISVAEAYDALTSDRSYRNAFPAYEALQTLNDKSGVFYDEEVLKALSEIIQPFPIGTIVMLNTKITGVVVKTNDHDSFRPVVKVLCTNLERQLIDMTKHSGLTITGIRYNV